MEKLLLTAILGPIVTELEKGANADLNSVREKLEADVDGEIAKIGVPTAAVNATIDDVFSGIQLMLAKAETVVNAVA